VLEGAQFIGFIPVADLAVARTFYVSTLELPVLDDSPFALVVDASGTSVRITPVGEFTPHPFTIAGWDVPDIDATIAVLDDRGVGRTGCGKRPVAILSPGSKIPTATPCR